MDRPLNLSGLEAKFITAESYANLDLLIPGHHTSDRSPAKLALPVEAHIIPYLKPGVLISGDTLGHFGVTLDFQKQLMMILDCDFETQISIQAKDHSRIKRIITVKERITVPAHSVIDRKSTRLNSSHVEISYAV